MRTQTRSIYQDRIQRVIEHVHAHLDHAQSLDELARVAHFSPFHFHRVFQAMVGETVTELARRLRMERAACQLRTGEESITRIAFAAGYEAHESFTRAFRSMFGKSPSAYRRTDASAPFKVVPSGVHYQPGGPVPMFTPVDAGAVMIEVEVRKLEPMKVAYVRHTGPYMECGTAWEKLMAWAGPKGLCGPQTRCLGICYDNPDNTPAGKIRYDACIALDRELTPEPPVQLQEVAGGAYAVATHIGSYSKLKASWEYLCGQWLPASGRELRHAPPFEIYCNNPQTTPEDELHVELHLPLV